MGCDHPAHSRAGCTKANRALHLPIRRVVLRLLVSIGLWCLAAMPGTAVGIAHGRQPHRAEAPSARADTLPAGYGPQDWGPLQFPTPLSPFQKLRLVFFHQSPLLPPAGTWTFASTATWANLWVHDEGRLLVDAEAWSLNEFLEYSLSDRWAASLMLPLIYLTGGVMDGAIEGFHDTFGLGNMGRERFPRNDVRMEVVRADGQRVRIVDSDGSSLWMRAPVLSLRYGVTGRDAPVAISVKASVDLPEAERESNIVRDSGRDWGLGASFGARLGKRTAGLLSVAYLGLRAGKLPRDFALRRSQWSTTVGLTFALSPTTAVATQMAHETAAARDTGTGFDRATVNFSFGMKWLLEPGLVLEGALVENLIVADNNADFALHGGATYTF